MPCRHCARSGFFSLLLLAFVGGCQSAADLASDLAAAEEASPAGDAYHALTDREAWDACRSFAADRLHDPASAEWPSFPSPEVHVQRDAELPNRFGVISSVRAPDSRGRMVPQTVVCMLDWERERQRWEPVTVASKYGGLYDRQATLSIP